MIDFESTIRLQTGDITKKSAPVRTFSLSSDTALGRVTATIDDSTSAAVSVEEWSALCDQLSEKDLHRWQNSPDNPRPIGQPDFHNLLVQIDSTPSFQLLIAAFDISNFCGFPSSSPEDITFNLDRLSDVRLGTPRSGFLYFLPDWIILHSSGQVIEELVRNNKLCNMTWVAGNDSWHNVYVPYATPTDFSTPVTPETEPLWRKISQMHRTARSLATPRSQYGM